MRSRIEIVLMAWPLVATLGLIAYARRRSIRRSIRRWCKTWRARLRHRARWAPSIAK